ncbi:MULTISPECIES: hypothetical protein [Sphingomonas]|uniref:hypothetical protein n=1 Tax=Sphingomonas TaxID=13687 RepID=UPI00082DADF2|nr:hypothetical protein [Sphingomonas sp. CCH10-B3]MBA3879275.1 hypothetical protein [Sphingobium sp.]
MKAVGLILPLVLLAGCGSAGGDPGGASATEASQLNDAAAMLDEDSVSANAVLTNQAESTKP